jgi:hypothetical protein
MSEQDNEPQFVDGHALVGLTGEFTIQDETFQCRVTGTDKPPWDNDLLIVEYVRDGLKITDAMIPASAFRPDANQKGHQ